MVGTTQQRRSRTALSSQLLAQQGCDPGRGCVLDLANLETRGARPKRREPVRFGQRIVAIAMADVFAPETQECSRTAY